MSISVGSSSDALATIQSLLQTVANTAGNAAGVGPVGDWLASAGKSMAEGAGGSGQAKQPFRPAPPPLQSDTMAALLALKGQETGGNPRTLFAKLDKDGDGTISPSELQAASGASGGGSDGTSAAALFDALDRNADGGVDQGELTSALRRGHGRRRHAAGLAQPGGAAHPVALIEQLAKTQAQLSSKPAATTSAVA